MVLSPEMNDEMATRRWRHFAVSFLRDSTEGRFPLTRRQR